MEKLYVVRLNTRPDENQFKWRIWEDGNELTKLAIAVKENSTVYTLPTTEDFPDLFGSYLRFNLDCRGNEWWDEENFIIGSV